ncbi:YTH domain-containing family protein 2 [Ananas comosus]|uniref:YTH domain-containing family protein n=1 Tax=Ananas comosus TaxID=4615 RepID=A0A199VUF7_ANACO|nr:YTH domain-containing family protein 2 [Ananas comosus]
MASEITKEKDVQDVVENLKLDSNSKTASGEMAGQKDGSTSDAISCISSADANSSIKESEVEQEALFSEPSSYYTVNGLSGYPYSGFDGSFGGWDSQTFIGGTEGLDVQHSANQVDNGSFVYYFPGFHPGYSPYSPVIHGAVTSPDGQYMGQQLFYQSPIYSQPLASPGFVSQPVTYPPELIPAYSWDSYALFVDGIHGNGFGGDTTFPFSGNNLSPQGHARSPSKPSPQSKSNSLEKKGASNQYLKPVSKPNGSIAKDVPLTNKVLSYAGQGKIRLLYPNSPSNTKESGRNGAGTEKLNGTNTIAPADFDSLNDQKSGPRTTVKNSGIPEVGSGQPKDPAKENDNSSTMNLIVKKDEYNLPDFPTKYDHALFFVIKSYSEDDIHKSIKYNVWSSTPNGNRRLDNAFQVGQEKSREKGTKCPVFLFFSVNASGQFCGLAEMIGRVDFSKNMDFWQQDKWNGYFPVKWHIIKDIPNPQFRHLILENNDNKPVTNSRDTQEVKFPQGTEMLSIFKSYCSKTSILDDFAFYENRQKILQEKKNKTSASKLELLEKKTTEVTEVPKPVSVDYIVSGVQKIDLNATKAKEDLSAVGVVKK